VLGDTVIVEEPELRAGLAAADTEQFRELSS